VRNTAIEVRNLTKIYGNLKAVDNVSFDVYEGEVFAFLGPNGAGKTTTIEILQGLRKATSGSAKVLGYDVSNKREVNEMRKKIGILPQEFNALDRLTVAENVKLFREMYDNGVNVNELLSLLGLEEKANILFQKLSSGLKQRVGLAAALVNDPELIFLDEPTTGLDPSIRRDVWSFLERLKKENKTIFLTTHYMEEAERLSDRVAIINKGKIIAIGETRELIKKYGMGDRLVIEELRQEEVEELSKLTSDATVKNNTIEVRIGSLDRLNYMIQVLAKKGIKAKVRIESSSLEDVFLKLVGARISEEGELT
jgi:ABC-2 type transport system ATP-binding protein